MVPMSYASEGATLNTAFEDILPSHIICYAFLLSISILCCLVLYQLELFYKKKKRLSAEGMPP